MKESCRELGGPGASWALEYLEETVDMMLYVWECLLRGASWSELGLQNGDGAE